MADESKPKKPKPEGGAHKADKKAKAPEGGAPKADKKAEKAAGKPEKAPEPPRPPADPRIKILKKFKGRFLPRGPLRDRHVALISRWSSGEDHGGVTLEELRSLYEDWKAARARPAKA